MLQCVIGEESAFLWECVDGDDNHSHMVWSERVCTSHNVHYVKSALNEKHSAWVRVRFV